MVFLYFINTKNKKLLKNVDIFVFNRRMEVLKIVKNIKLSIYLMKKNLPDFRLYLREKYQKQVTRNYIDKTIIKGNIDRGMIFLHEEILPPPDWLDYINTFAQKKTIKIKPKKVNKALVFLTIKNNDRITFALAFGSGATLLDEQYIVSDFGVKISKSLLSVSEIISIDSTSIDRKIFNTRRQSSTFLLPERLVDLGTQNIFKNIHGVYEEFNEQFSLGGTESLSFRGKIDLLEDIVKWLDRFPAIYSTGKNNLGVPEDLVSTTDEIKEALDKKMGQKILDIISNSTINKRNLSSLRISPNVTFDLTDFNGFFISGVRSKSGLYTDFFIDEVDYFERFKRKLKPEHKNVEGILAKIKRDMIFRKADSQEDTAVCSIYRAMHFEITHHNKKYILISGVWYEIDRNFYGLLQKDINSIKRPVDHIQYIQFDKSIHFQMKKGKQCASEGAYNREFAKKNNILLLDQEDYRVDLQTMKTYGLKTQSSIELSDALYFDSEKIQFIHVKRHSGASGISHLLTQALVSAQAFLNDNTAVVDHINKKISDFNASNNNVKFRRLEYSTQRKEIVFAIVEEKLGPNSKLLSILEMITMRQTIKNLESLGFICYLEFIPGK